MLKFNMIGLLLLMVLPWKVTKAANDSSVPQTEATGKIIDSHQWQLACLLTFLAGNF